MILGWSTFQIMFNRSTLHSRWPLLLNIVISFLAHFCFINSKWVQIKLHDNETGFPVKFSLDLLRIILIKKKKSRCLRLRLVFNTMLCFIVFWICLLPCQIVNTPFIWLNYNCDYLYFLMICTLDTNLTKIRSLNCYLCLICCCFGDLKKPHCRSFESDPMYHLMKMVIVRLWKCYLTVLHVTTNLIGRKRS